MGVPAFFRYMTEKYPKIIEHLIEDRTAKDIEQPLPQFESHGYEFDNLYIDMNGIIHPCAHPEDRKAPSSETEMYQNVTTYVDRLFAAVRPKKLLFLAIDGVAPRAKMNQQRSRRFRAAQDAAEKDAIMSDIKKDMGIGGEGLSKGNHSEWDSNVITPGTPFMHRLADYIRTYIIERINNGGPAWRRVTVIFSDASEPGEGEHKIMSYIRQQRAMPGYNPNLRHILHGLDADLIMLGLATHEAHFTVLREEVLFGRAQHSQSAASRAQDNFDLLKGTGGIDALPSHKKWCYLKPFVMCQIPILREYLAAEFGCLLTKLPFGFDFERIVDDFVFLCFFVGNDFLPHLPTLDIRDGAVDFLFNVYKRVLPTLGNYLTGPGGEVHLEHVDIVLAEVGTIEDEVFQRRKSADDADRMRNIQRKARNKIIGNQAEFERHALVASGDLSSAVALKKPTPLSEASNKNAAQALKTSLLGKNSTVNNTNEQITTTTNEPEETSLKRKAENDIERNLQENDDDEKEEVFDHNDEDDDDDDDDDGPSSSLVITDEKKAETAKELEERYKAKSQAMLDEYKEKIEDEVRFWQAGWKERYYADKYKDRDITKGGGRERVFKEYIAGLCWVMKYYYDGCPSWKWYYPFHYAPFASDLRNIEHYKPEFDQVGPFRPIEQLMAVLPKESHKALPIPCHSLMLDSNSPISDFYPLEVEIDPNGKAMPWLWVALLPFIDEERLLLHLNKIYPEFDQDSKDRNRFRLSTIFAHKENENLGSIISKLHEISPKGPILKEISCSESGIAGKLTIPDYQLEPFHYNCHIKKLNQLVPISQDFDQSVMIDNQVVSICFEGPTVLPHKSELLVGVQLPPPKLSILDFNIRIPRINRGLNISDLGCGNNQELKNNSLQGKGNPFNNHQSMIQISNSFSGYNQGKGGKGYQQQQYTQGLSSVSRSGPYNNQYHQTSSYYRGGGKGGGGGRESGNSYQFQRPQQYNQSQGQYQQQQHYPPVNYQSGYGPPIQQQQFIQGGYQQQRTQSHTQYHQSMQGQHMGQHPSGITQQGAPQPPSTSLDSLRMGLAQTLAKRAAPPATPFQHQR